MKNVNGKLTKNTIISFLFLVLLVACSDEISNSYGQIDGNSKLEVTDGEPTIQVVSRRPPNNFSEEPQIYGLLSEGVEFYKTDIMNIDWTADGQYLIGTLSIPGLEEIKNEVYLWNPVKNEYSILSTGKFGGYKTFISSNPNNNLILYGHVSYIGKTLQGFQEEPTGLWIVDINNGNLEYISEEIYGDWLLSDEKIITDKFEILDILNSDVSALDGIDDFHNIEYISVSPNSDYLAFIAQNENSEPASLFLYSFSWQEITKLVEVGPLSKVGWSDDGNWLLYLDSSLFAYDVSTLCRTRAFKLPDKVGEYETEGITTNFSWSPDGKTLAVGGWLEDVGVGIYFIKTDSELFQDWLSTGTCE